MTFTQRCHVTDADAIERALDVLKRGGLVAVPTETVYGLAADATNERAVAKIFEAKGRPQFNPLIVHCSDLSMAENFGVLSAEAKQCAAKFWPGPLTLVVPSSDNTQVSSLLRAGLSSVALRVPRGPTRLLIEAFGRPLAAPSANLSGKVSASSADHVEAQLAGRVDLILDDGQTDIGLESTIISFVEEQPRLLRPGGLTVERLEDSLTLSLAFQENGSKIAAPGMMLSHYAPSTKLRLGATGMTVHEDGALTFGPSELVAEHLLCLSEAGDLQEAATRLFTCLHRLDELEVKNAAVSPIPDIGLGRAINDRLRRAAAPR